MVAITGACSFLGGELLKRLEEDPNYERVLALDIRRPAVVLEKAEYHEIDLTVPSVDRSLAALFEDCRVDTVVHAAFLSFPTHAAEWAHELEDIGTMHVLNACAQARPARLIMTSTTLVYGAAPDNPNFLSERDPLREAHPAADARFIDDKVNAEKQLAQFADEHPEIQVAVLRFAPILGPTVQNLFTRYFSRPLAVALLGHDPLIQLVHESDAANALALAVERDVEGPLNIVGHGVLPYRTVLALLGRMPLTVPLFLARPLHRALWVTQLFDAPPSFLDFLRFLCVADGTRARRELGFQPHFDVQRTLMDFLGIAADDGAPDPIHAQG
ncbi:NAD-dependent epimerase/dehydratase family protein [Haliangium ochraceum]|uniref:NAD-dependent epimerase/dehydratase family protein n=1 Tax=Haliangium ochraceum TaxID=80816 RepID=UPI00019BA822|nr:NAD-dependent epimerase/dehydratase family protein [Haliangium ochraceum]